MKSRVLVIVLLLILITTATVSATGLGAAFGLPLGGLPGTNVMLSAKIDQLPLLGLGFTLGQEVFTFGLTADWWVLNNNLFSFVNYYLGPGLYVAYNNNVFLGARLPVGLNIFPIKNFELFIEIAPTLALQFSDPIHFPVFGAQGAFGLRFWF